MDCTFTQLPYGDTGYFTGIVNAYTTGDQTLRPFYKHSVSVDGVREVIEDRKKVAINRTLLVNTLKNQYETLPPHEKVLGNIDLLAHENTFTVTTAHQPAIFTGNLFFIYKILHAIRLATFLKQELPEYDFVPVFYMGSEDADLEELGHIFLGGEKINWNTKQTGAIGRMNTKGLDLVLNRIEGELSILPHGGELLKILRDCYLNSSTIQEATLKLIHHLFSAFGLVVLIPDQRELKREMIPVFEKELFEETSSSVVQQTLTALGEKFKVQAQPRNINLFYLKENMRERIERSKDQWSVVNTDITFNAHSLKEELENYPERFSPNVILRGLFQASILPDVAFIGGGGEIAYWLELKELFEYYGVPYPVLVIRNSFLVIEKKWKDKMDGLRIAVNDIFLSETSLMNKLVKRDSGKKISLAQEISEFNSYYDHLKSVAEEIDGTLTGHVSALQTRAIKPLHELEKKLLRAEKRKFSDQERQINTLRKELFPNHGLQERVENFMPFYSRWGNEFIRLIYDHSLTLEQQFSVLLLNE